jgi:hypothetical protein
VAEARQWTQDRLQLRVVPTPQGAKILCGEAAEGCGCACGGESVIITKSVTVVYCGDRAASSRVRDDEVCAAFDSRSFHHHPRAVSQPFSRFDHQTATDVSGTGGGSYRTQ